MNSIGRLGDSDVRGRFAPRTSGPLQSAAVQILTSAGFSANEERDRTSSRVNGGRAGQGAPLPESLHWDVPRAGLAQLCLLVVDEDAAVRGACGEIAARMGFVVLQATDAGGAQIYLKSQKVDLMLLDINIAGITGRGLALLEQVRAGHPGTSVVVMTAAGTVASAVEAMRRGAEDYLTKPFALEELVTILERASKRTHLNQETRALRDRLRRQHGSGPLIGHSPEMEKLYRIVSKVAHSTHPVLILGEDGTGKELIGRSIHFNGPHASQPFIPVDCKAFAPALLEGELFGWVKGAMHGRPGAAAGVAKDGLLAMAGGGTIFLDGIGDLPVELQAKLLHTLHERVVHPVGGTHTVPLTARVLAATSRDLTVMVEQGKFRKDLYFRLNVVSLRIPALRQRKEDIPELAQFFLERVARDTGAMHSLSDEALRVMVEYDWPGNVRELGSAVERGCAMCSGTMVHVEHLPSVLQQLHAQVLRQAQAETGESQAGDAGRPEGIQSIAEMEKQAILDTIRELRGDKLLAAKLLGIGKTTLYRKLKEYGIQEWSVG